VSGKDLATSEPATAWPSPRIEAEVAASPRLDVAPLVTASPPARGPSTLGLAASGASVLALGLSALQVGNFAVDQFARSAALGWATVGVAVAGFGLIGAGAWRELRGLFALRTVDRLRAALSGPDPHLAKPLLRDWLAGLPDGAAVIPALDAINDPDAIPALLRAGPLADLRARSDALGRTAAVQVFAAAAVIPSPLLDGLLVAWRGVRLVREVAALHGMRPGLLGTAALLRRTMFSAAAVVGTDMALDATLRAVLSNPLLRHVVGDVAGAGVAARRMILLSRAAAAACSPLRE
jgi:uncharacterized membrane protein YcjF (UPF0283 family)